MDPDPAPDWNIQDLLTVAVNDLIPEMYTPGSNDNRNTGPMEEDTTYVNQCEIPTQIFDHSIPTIKMLQHTQSHEPQEMPPHFIVQLDGGANRSITNNPNLLHHFRNIRRYAMAGISDGAPALYCTGKGYLMWKAATGEVLAVSCYYSHQASETIISPTDVVLNHIGTYNAWSQHADIDNGSGHITFYHRNGVDHAVYSLYMQNGLWFYSTHAPSLPSPSHQQPVIRRLTAILYYVLIHLRLAHAGKRTMSEVHRHFSDLPKATTRNVPLLNCASCAETNVPCRSFDTNIAANTREPEQPTTDNVTDDAGSISLAIQQPLSPDSLLVLLPEAEHLPDYIKTKLSQITLTAHRFHMDFGFPRGSSYKGFDSATGQTFTSIDGYKAYLLIIMYPQRRVWVFPTKNKQPPIDILRTFLRKYDTNTVTHKVIRTDQGGELWKSASFRKVCCDEFSYILEPTAAGTPEQNGLAERPNRTFGKMMRCLLHSAGLGPQYWSFALLHAVWVYNRLPHSATGVSPYTAFSGKLPSAKHLRIFGCRVIVRLSGERRAKLDSNSTTGIFLGYTATDKNILYMDEKTREIKTATHAIFDEAHLTAPRTTLPPAAAVLQHLGFSKDDQDQPDADADSPVNPEPYPNDILAPLPTVHGQATAVKINADATIPTRGSTHAVGYDLYSADSVIIEPGARTKIDTGVAITPPSGFYGQILSRSGLAANHNIDCLAGVIDPDYTGPLIVLLQNSGKMAYHVHKGDKIAQLVFLAMATPQLQIASQLQQTDRANQGFGSTDTRPAPDQPLVPATMHDATTSPKISNLTEIPSVAMPYDISLSHEPFDFFLNISVDLWGQHPTLGLILAEQDAGRVVVKGMERSTPGHRIPKWRSTLTNATLLRVAHESPDLDRHIATIAEFTEAVATHRAQNSKSILLQFATTTPTPLHPATGNPQIHLDQLNAVQKILFQIRQQKQDSPEPHGPVINTAQVRASTAPREPRDETDTQPTATLTQPIHLNVEPDLIPDFTTQIDAGAEELSQTFTLKQLKARPDWPEWRQSQFKQLQQYADQHMFGNPEPLPQGANVLYLLWTYVLKVNGTKKARCVCNGNRNRGAVTMGHIFANALTPNAERLFWAITAKEGLTAIGADVSNAFAEAPPPEAPFYVYVDDVYRDWWENELGKPPIPKGYVLRVHHALQGHPESPRLWERHIDKILKKHGFQPTTHDPCLYHYTKDNTRILFLRQVDDFAVAARDPSDAHRIIQLINSSLSIPVKDQGIIEWYNGIDVEQTKYYIRLHATTYFNKMLKNHGWFDTNMIEMAANDIIPMSGDNEYLRRLDRATPPDNPADQANLQSLFGFKYRQVVGEILYPMVKCRPDLSNAIIKLSQYMSNPAKEHYEAVHHLIKYIATTYNIGITFWRDTECDHLPDKPLPKLHPDNYTIDLNPPDQTMYAYTDSDWGGDQNHRRSITGIIVMYAGGAIGYKTKYQDTIALSSTEAEFIAACDAAKLVLYFRSLLQELNIPQEDATVIYEDNRGALMMVAAGQPTKNSRHIDIKHYAILDWTERDLVALHSISTHDNASDGMTKPLAKQLFHRHSDTYMGRRAPKYFRDKYPFLFSK